MLTNRQTPVETSPPPTCGGGNNVIDGRHSRSEQQADTTRTRAAAWLMHTHCEDLLQMLKARCHWSLSRYVDFTRRILLLKLMMLPTIQRMTTMMILMLCAHSAFGYKKPYVNDTPIIR